ncbi:flagellar protein FlaG [Shewanella sp. A32]|nr:flagellar protein FlaG [Shewanella sp. A32]MDF0532967.1 flagellar protein FlaG [Shewanella sp. A32]
MEIMMSDLSISASNAVAVNTGVNIASSGATIAAGQDSQNQQKTKNVNANEGSTQAQNQQSGAKSQDNLQSVTEQLSQTMEMMRKGLQFRVDEQSGENVVSVFDIESGDVIRQIPSDEALKLAAKLSEVADGLLMKTQA